MLIAILNICLYLYLRNQDQVKTLRAKYKKRPGIIGIGSDESEEDKYNGIEFRQASVSMNKVDSLSYISTQLP